MSAAGGAGAGAATASTTVPFPEGYWTLYFHAPEDRSYTLKSYNVIAVIDSWEKLWSTFQLISDTHLLSGMFFLMKGTIPPLWEHSANQMGGTYQIKVVTENSRETYETYCAAAILNFIATNADNTIKGVSISSKKGHNIIKLWNHSSAKYNKPSDIQLLSAITGEVIYIPFVKKDW